VNSSQRIVLAMVSTRMTAPYWQGGPSHQFNNDLIDPEDPELDTWDV
jgi:hypothetical protein